MTFWGAIKYAGILLVALVVLYFSFLYFSYLDETITEGEGYDFTIGMTKVEAFKIAKENYQLEKPYVFYSDIKTEKISYVANMVFSKEDFNMLKQYDFWYFRYTGNSMRLTFNSGLLVKIDRHRQYFELP